MSVVDEVEEWKPIVGYEGLYEISSYGRVKSVKNNVFQNRIRAVHICQPAGYFIISLGLNGKAKRFPIHRLVAFAFIPNPLGKRTVNHINGVKTDNRISNLEWATDSEQQIHSIRIGIKKKPFGKPVHFNGATINNNRSRPVEQLDKSGKSIAVYKSAYEAYRLVGIHQTLISRCCRGIIKETHGYIFKFQAL